MAQELSSSQVKIKTIDSNFALTGTRYSTTSTAFTDLTNASMTYTSGPTPEKLFLSWSVMGQANTVNAEARLVINGVQAGQQVYIDAGVPWYRAGTTTFYDVAANTTLTLKIQVFCASGTTLAVTTESERWKPVIKGLAFAQ